jgi:hypothetical protein
MEAAVTSGEKQLPTMVVASGLRVRRSREMSEAAEEGEEEGEDEDGDSEGMMGEES